MKDHTKYSYSLTLRSSAAVFAGPGNVASHLKLLKSGFIRRAVLRALIHAKEHELPLLADPTLRRGRQK